MNYDGMKKLSMEEVKKVELDLLITFDAFCKKHHLRYVLDGGTLIGAMRHQGFIPWDDDIDVAMPFPDFLKFKEPMRKNAVIVKSNFCSTVIIEPFQVSCRMQRAEMALFF